jgi:hypothetical protein
MKSSNPSDEIARAEKAVGQLYAGILCYVLLACTKGPCVTSFQLLFGRRILSVRFSHEYAVELFYRDGIKPVASIACIILR